ncbi:MAG: hypothetical protein R2875_12255 [Desulfobacterales bacterium]
MPKLLTGYAGPKAFQGLAAAGIKIGQNLDSMTVRQAIEKIQGWRGRICGSLKQGRASKMKIAVASGKGGTGKTTVSSSWHVRMDLPVIAMDLDVEEPNLHLFKSNAHRQPRPHGNSGSGPGPVHPLRKKCSDLCQFKAISLMKSAHDISGNVSWLRGMPCHLSGKRPSPHAPGVGGNCLGPRR